MLIKKIAFIHINFPCGGAEKITTHISDELVKIGYQIYLFAEKIEADKLCLKDKSIILQQTPTSVYSRESADFIIDQINKNQIDLFICPGLVLNYLPRIRKETNCKVVYSHHSMPFWEITAKITAGEHASHKSLGKRIEWLLFRAPKYKLPHYLKKKVYNSYKLRYDEVDSYTVLCEAYAQEICRKIGIERGKSKITVLTNPIMNPPTEIKEKKKQLVFVGRLTFADKRVDRLLYIWQKLYQQHPDWSLLIYGDGEEKENLIRLSQQLNLKRVEFMGYQTNTTQIYEHASVLCMTSSYEGWPLVLTEAQAHGVIPIAFNCCAGIEEIISPDNKYGFLIKPFDTAEYVKALQSIMSDPALLKSMQSRVIESANRYTVEQVTKQWLSFLKSFE
ncbi:MAG: glycosyltransferase [Bacteroidales bacterium]